MTSEQNAPEVESHQGSTMSPGQQDGEAQFTPHNVQHGMGQSKSSRRRRRKRKNKGIDAQQGTPSSNDQGAGQPVASIPGSAAPQAPQQQSFQPAGMRAGVVIQNRNVLRCRLTKRLVHCGSEADVTIVRDHSNPAARLLLVSYRVPCAVVHHHHFKIGKRLTLHGGQAFVKSLVRGQRWNNHSHRWVHLAGPGFSYHRWVFAAVKPRRKT